MRRLLMLSMLVLLWPASASGSTLGKVKGDLVYAGAPGEANAPSIFYDRKARRFTLADAGATITTTGPCTLTGDTATCPVSRFGRLEVRLGDGDDTLTFTDGSLIDEYLLGEVDGGPGNDVLDVTSFGVTGGAGDDEVTSHSVYEVEGGDGNDTLIGNGTITGGPGADALRGTSDGQLLSGGPGVDTIDGGGGERQEVSFREATTPVTADVGADGPMGPAGEQDTVSGVSGVIGGKGDDILTGDERDNALQGGDGDDTLVAGDGDDVIEAGPGTDRVEAGDGDDELGDSAKGSTADALLDAGTGSDVIKSRDSGAEILGGGGGDEIFIGPRTRSVDAGAGSDQLISRTERDAGDEISCGTGADIAKGLGLGLIPPDCERIAFQHPKVGAVIDNAVVLRARSLTVPVPNLCPDVCDTEVTLRSGERVLARASERVKNRRNGEATLALSARARRRITASGRATVHYDTGGEGHIQEATVTFPVD